MDGTTIAEDSIQGSTPLPDTSAPAAGEGPVLKQIPLALIVAARNPRHASRDRGGARTAPNAHSADAAGDTAPAGRVEPADADPDLDGLARSLGSEQDPHLAEPPVVEEMPDGSYRLCAGERRVEAARLANWTRILCLVYPPMDPVRAHTLGLVENLHRLPMHPLEEISALSISRLLANADARGVGGEARRMLEDAWKQRASSYTIIEDLEQILRASGWTPERPDVTWKAHLDDLGISMAPWERKRKLRLLNIEPALQEQLRELDITEAAMRSLGTLEPGDQERVVEALLANPSLVRKVRRIARARRDGFYTSIEDALAEVQGLQGLQAWTPDSSAPALDTVASSPGASTGATSATPALPLLRGETELPATHSSAQGHIEEGQVPPEIQDAVLQLLECADRLSSAMNTLRAYGGGTSLPEPWGAWSSDAIEFISQQCTR